MYLIPQFLLCVSIEIKRNFAESTFSIGFLGIPMRVACELLTFNILQLTTREDVAEEGHRFPS